MPSSVLGAIVGSFVSNAAIGIIGGAFGAAAMGTIAARVVGGLVGAVVGGAVTSVLGGHKQPESRANPTVAARGRTITIRQAAAPWAIIYGQARVGGVVTFVYVSDDRQYIHLVITLAGHVCNAIGDIYFGEEVVPLDGNGDATGTFAGYARVKTSLGGESGQPFVDLVNESAGKWTDAHRQTGRTKLYVKLKANPDLFQTGVPNISAVVQGRKVYDPRSATTVYSRNAALCASDYITNATFGLGATYATEIDETQLIAAANLCDEDVPLASSVSPNPTEDRYSCNGSFLVSTEPQRALGLLLAAMAGKAVNVGGKWYVFAGAYEAPTITLDEGDLAGAIHLQNLVSRRANANAVKGVFTDPDSSWQVTDFPALASSAYLSEDNSERVWKDLDLSAFVTSGTQAQRLAKIELLSLRQSLTVTAAFKLTAWQCMTGRTVALTNTKFGWTAKAFEVIASQFIVSEDGTLGVALTLRETAAAVFDWASSEEQTVDIAPNTGLPDFRTVAAPGVPGVTEAVYETRDGRGVAAKAIVSIGQSTYPFGCDYQLEYKLSSAATYTVLPRVRPASGSTGALTVDVLDIASGTYDFRVKVIGVAGDSSAYATVTNRSIQGLSARPAAVAGLTLQKLGGIALLRWDRHADLDVLRGGRILTRHTEDASPSWEGTVSIGDPEGVPGDQVFALVPLKTGTYLVRAEDSTGNASLAATTISSDGAIWLIFSTVGSVQEDPSFPGTHSSTVLDGSTLKLLGAGLFDDIPDLDAISSLDDYGGVSASGVYTFSAGLDLGSTQRVRLVSTIVALTVNVNDLMDDRATSIDDWVDFDGTSGGGSADCYLESRSTNDNPAGSPTWSAWNRLDASEYNARAFQFRAQLRSTDVAYNEHVTQLRVTAQQVT